MNYNTSAMKAISLIGFWEERKAGVPEEKPSEQSERTKT